MATIDLSKTDDNQLVKEHLLSIILCLCDLLDDCGAFWVGMAPDSHLQDMEEQKLLVLVALGTAVDMLCELCKIDRAVSKGVAWLYRQLQRFGKYAVP